MRDILVSPHSVLSFETLTSCREEMEAMLQAQSPHVSEMEETTGEKIHYVYDAAAERAKELALQEAPDSHW